MKQQDIFIIHVQKNVSKCYPNCSIQFTTWIFNMLKQQDVGLLAVYCRDFKFDCVAVSFRY